jgi:hypothetical protein
VAAAWLARPNGRGVSGPLPAAPLRVGGGWATVGRRALAAATRLYEILRCNTD